MDNLDTVATRGGYPSFTRTAAKFLSVAALLTAPLLSSGQSLDMDQMANGKLGDNPLVLSWQNGNLNKSNSHFLTTYSVPYRVKMEDLKPNTQYTYVGGIDIRVQGKNALDFYTHYQRLDPHTQFNHPTEVVNPVTTNPAVTGALSADFVSYIPSIGSPSTFAIPAPPNSKLALGSQQPSTFYGTLPGAEKLMTLWGGTINAVGYDFMGSLTDAASEARIYVTFTTGPLMPNKSTVKAVLAYGANIAGDGYWGIGEGAQAISGNGSPYHSRVRGIREGGWLAYATNAQMYVGGGSADRSLKQDAVYPSSACMITGVSSVCPGAGATFTANSSGTYSWSIAPTGGSATGVMVGSTTSQTLSVTATGACGSTYTVSVTVGNTGQLPTTCSKIVTIQDNDAPTVTSCPSNGTAACNGQVTFGTPTFSDNCDQNLTITPSTGSTANQDGSTTYWKEWVATDDCGNASATCRQEITQQAAPAAPCLSIVNPTCNSLGTITVESPSNPQSGPAIYEYRNGSGAWQTSNQFSFVGNEGYSIQVRRIDDNTCVSGATECPNLGPCAQNRQQAPGVTTPAKGQVLDQEEAWLQVYPNPFTMNSTLEFKVPTSGQVVMQVFDVNGRMVKEVYNGKHVEAGAVYRVPLVASDYGSGAYVVRLSMNGKMLKSVRILHQK